MLKVSLFIVMIFVFSGCGGQAFLVVDDNVAKYMKNSKKIVVYTPDVHMIDVGFGSYEEDLNNSKKLVQEFVTLSTSKLSNNYVVSKMLERQRCGILETDLCTNQFILESRDIVKAIKESRGAFNSTPDEFEYSVNTKKIDEFKEADLVVYIKATQYNRTAGKITADLLFSITIGALTGFIPIFGTTPDTAEIIVYDNHSGKAILHDSMSGYLELDKKDKLQYVVDTLFANLQNNVPLAIN